MYFCIEGDLMAQRKNRPAVSDLIPPRDELVRQAMTLRDVHGATWATNIATYETLLEIKRSKGIYPLNMIKKSELTQYPKIHFMEIKDKKSAEEYLRTMNVEQIFHLISDIETALDSYIYITVRNRIMDYRAEIKRQENGVNIYAVDPDIRIPSQKKNFGKRGTANPEGL